MSAAPPATVACVTPDCRKVVGLYDAVFFADMPYCSEACGRRWHHGPNAIPRYAVPLEEKQP